MRHYLVLPIRPVIFLMAISCLLVGCSHRQTPAPTSGDAKQAQMILGSWATSGGIIEFDADGSSTASFTNQGGKRLFYQCGWKITNGWIVVTVDHVVANTTNHEPAGAVERVQITTLDLTNLVWHTTNGFDLSCRRLK